MLSWFNYKWYRKNLESGNNSAKKIQWNTQREFLLVSKKM